MIRSGAMGELVLRFLAVVAWRARERRLSRIAYRATRPT
jgi:hypothetical protein